MSASPLIVQVYHEFLAHYGEPDHCISFDDPPPPDQTFPQRLDVLIWESGEKCDMTTLATVGMADRPMAGSSHRAELVWSIRAALTPEEHQKAAAFLANLAMYPFFHRTRFDWWHRLTHSRRIPVFPSCSSLFFLPRFVPHGWDTVDCEGLIVRLLSIIPLTEEEYALGSAEKALDWMIEQGIDIIAPK